MNRDYGGIPDNLYIKKEDYTSFFCCIGKNSSLIIAGESIKVKIGYINKEIAIL